MKNITKLKIAAVHQFCDVNDKSTEYTYQLIMDIVRVDMDTVNNYMTKEDHKKLFNEINDFVDTILKLN